MINVHQSKINELHDLTKMKIMKNLLLILLIIPFLAWSQIASWDFSSENNLSTSTPEVYDANLDSPGDLTRGLSAGSSTGGDSFRTTGFQNNGISVTNTDYFQNTLSATTGYTLSLSTIDALFKGTSTFSDTPGVSMQYAYSLDGTTFTLIGSPFLQIGNGNMAQIDVSGISELQNVAAATTVTIRFYASGQTTTGGWGYYSASLGNIGLAFGGALVAVTPTWTGTTSTDWNTASNWTPASVPTSTSNVIIPTGTVTPTVSTLTIGTGQTLAVNANANLTITGVLTNNGTITLSSGATLVQGASSTVAGSGTWNVNQATVGSGITSSVTGRFYYMGSPVAASTTNALNPSAANRVWSYNESAAAFTEISGNSTGLSVGQGYGTIFGGNQTVNFTGGAINNGAINVSGLTKTGTSSASGYNLVSNPYPSYLDWDAITKTNIEPSIWFQTKDALGNKVFDVFSLTTGLGISNSGSLVNQYIAPMQGFWTLVSSGTGSLAMTNSMRSHQPSSSGLKTQATDFPIFVRLNLKSGQRNDQTVIFFDENAADTKDAFDSEKMAVNGASQLYSVIENTKVAINGLNYTSGTAYSVPLTAVFNSDNEFSIEGTEVHVASGMVYLEDKLMQTMSNLSNNASYTFTAAAGVVEDRFVLHFQPNNALSIDELTKDKITITADISGNVSVVLNNPLNTEGTITVIDYAGRVLSTSAINQTSTKLKAEEAAGIYFVRVSNQNNIKTERIIISK